ncbi:MAG: hypothetical protein AAGE65_06970 [Planctomycetota bacterium]
MPLKPKRPKPWIPKSEAQLLEPRLTKWAMEDDLEVHSKRVLASGGKLCDVVLKRESTGEVHALVAKLNLSFEVLAQAFRHCQVATSWRIIVPFGRVAALSSKMEWYRAVLLRCQTGMITVAGPEPRHVSVWLNPRHADGPAFADAETVAQVAASIRTEEAGTQTAGSPGGGRESPEASLMADVRKIATEQPGTKLNHIVKQVRHRWPTDRAACNAVKNRLKSSSGPTGLRMNQQGVVEVLTL